MRLLNCSFLKEKKLGWQNSTAKSKNGTFLRSLPKYGSRSEKRRLRERARIKEKREKRSFLINGSIFSRKSELCLRSGVIKAKKGVLGDASIATWLRRHWPQDDAGGTFNSDPGKVAGILLLQDVRKAGWQVSAASKNKHKQQVKLSYCSIIKNF